VNLEQAASPGGGGGARPFGLFERMIAGRYLRAKRAQGGVAMISIISFLGILAMSTFYMQQRKKEIGIRKVNGATISQIRKPFI